MPSDNFTIMLFCIKSAGVICFTKFSKTILSICKAFQKATSSIYCIVCFVISVKLDMNMCFQGGAKQAKPGGGPIRRGEVAVL